MQENNVRGRSEKYFSLLELRGAGGTLRRQQGPQAQERAGATGGGRRGGDEAAGLC